METKVEQINQCEKEIFFFLNYDDLKHHFNSAYSEAQKHIKVKGFRPGKVPLPVIKQMYGKEIEREALNDIMNNVFNDYLKKNDLGFYGQPHVHKFEYDGNNFNFSLHIEVEPEFELAEYKDLVVDEPVHRVTDEEIDKQIELICEREGKVENTDFIEDYYSVVSLNITELDSNNEVIADKSNIKEHIYLKDERILPEIKESLINSHINDIVEVKIPAKDGQSEKNLRLEIIEIQKVIPAELNEELILKLSNNKFRSIEEFKEDIGLQLQEEWDRLSRKRLEDNLVEKILETQPEFDIPKSLLNIIKENIYKSDLERNKLQDTEENRAKFFNDNLSENAYKVARWQIILNKIIKKEKLEIEEHDLGIEAEKLAKMYNLTTDVVLNHIKNDKDFINSLLVKKAMDFLLDFTVTNEVQFMNENLSINNSYDEDENYEDEEELEEDFDEEFDENDLEFDEEELDEEYYEEEFEIDEDDDEDDEDEEEDYDDEEK